jgi:hypothetical protein
VRKPKLASELIEDDQPTLMARQGFVSSLALRGAR